MKCEVGASSQPETKVDMSDSGSTNGNSDYVLMCLAKSMGAEAAVIESPDDLNKVDIEAICTRNGPTLLDVRIDPNEPPPIGLRTNVLQSG